MTLLNQISSGSWKRTARFLVSSFIYNRPSYVFCERKLKLKSGDEIDYDIYDPPNASPKAVIVFIHGMSLRGRRDPRQVEVCESLLSCGYRVIAPEFPEISQTKIQFRSVSRIKETIKELQLDEKSSLGKKLGIFSVSFSASMAMLAACDQSMSKYISTIFSIGAFADVETVLKFIMKSESADEFSTMVVFHNFLHRSELAKNTKLKNAILAWITDNASLSAKVILPEHLKKLSESEKRSFNQIRSDLDFRRRQSRIMFNYGEKWRKKWSVRQNLQKLDIPIFLVHGKTDQVIPSSESKILFKELKRLGKEASLVITPLLNHGDRTIDINALRDLPDLLNAFKGFFEIIEKN